MNSSSQEIGQSPSPGLDLNNLGESIIHSCPVSCVLVVGVYTSWNWGQRGERICLRSSRWGKWEVDSRFSFDHCPWEGTGHLDPKETEIWVEKRKERGKHWTWFSLGVGREEGIPKQEKILLFSEVGSVYSSFLHHSNCSPPLLTTFSWIHTSWQQETLLLLLLNLIGSFFSFTFPNGLLPLGRMLCNMVSLPLSLYRNAFPTQSLGT